jgi:hypothetical protein
MTRRRCPNCGVPKALRVSDDGALQCVRNCGADAIARAAVRDAARLLPAANPTPAERTT